MGKIIRGLAAGEQIKIAAISGADIVEKARQIHGLSPTASAALGRTLLGASLLGNAMKGEDDSLTVQELIDYCNESTNISKYQAPRYYRFVKDLPRTATGKKQHFVIKKQAKQDLKDGLLLKR